MTFHPKLHRLKSAVARMERSTKEAHMHAGSLVARQVSQIGSLMDEEAKEAVLQIKASMSGVKGGSAQQGRRDVGTQTESDPVEAFDEEMQRLGRLQRQLLDATRSVPKNTANMVELLKKRNAVLLAREERALQRLRNQRLDKEQRVSQLERQLRRR